MSLASVAPITVSIPDKLDAIELSLNGRIQERPWAIRTAITALLCREHHIQTGGVGIAKTFLVSELVRHISFAEPWHYKHTLMSKYTVPEDLGGVIDIMGMREGRYGRVTAGTFVDAYIWFLDEVLRSNTATMDWLLTALNEGEIYNDGRMQQLPLISMFGGTNSLITDPAQAAFWDRIMFWVPVQRVQEKSSRDKMWKNAVAGFARQQEPQTLLTVAELEAAHAEVNKVVVPEVVYETMHQLVDNLFAAGINPSDRRITNCYRVIQASAYWNRRPVAAVEDMRLLRFVLPQTPKDQATVDGLVLGLADPIEKEALIILDLVEKYTAEANDLIRTADNPTQLKKEGIDIHTKLDRTDKDLQKLKEKAAAAGKKSESLDQASRRLRALIDRLLAEMFNMKPQGS